MTTATTTKSLSPTQAKIKETKREIASTKAKINEQNKQILEFEEAINLIETNPKYLPQPGELLPFDQLSKLLSDQETETEKHHKLSTAKQALQDCQESKQSLSADLSNFQNYLLYLQSEDEWETKYLPHAEKYRQAFPMKTSLQLRQQQIDGLVRDIANKKQILQQATEWLKAPREAKPRYFVAPPLDNPSTAQSYLPKAIPTLEAQLKALQETPVVESPDYQREFRQYVRARVLLEEPIKEFLKIQSAYRDAVDTLKKVFNQVPPNTITLDFGDIEPRKMLILDEDNVIRNV